ncbi:hypothetical protein T08_5382 [Trichinella sp. T8]|nr:hypothetical protein T08_5382 [Trichinella sp. T8]
MDMNLESLAKHIAFAGVDSLGILLIAKFTFLRCKSLNHCMKIEFRAKFVYVLKLSSFLPDAPLGTSKLDSNEDALTRAVRKLLCGISGGCFLVTAPDPWNKGTLRIDMTSGQEFFCQFTVSSSVWSDRTVLRKPPDAPFKFSR